jgi:hypothetical protein
MIISMNATVCGDTNHGEKRQFKIAGSDRGRRVQRGEEWASEQGIQEFQVLYEKGCSVAMLAVG